jgi:hypothetical protein
MRSGNPMQSCVITYYPEILLALRLKPDIVVVNEPGQHLIPGQRVINRSDIITAEEVASAAAWAVRWGDVRSSGWLLQQVIKLRLPIYLDQDIEFWDSDQEPGAEEDLRLHLRPGHYGPWAHQLWSLYGFQSLRNPATPFRFRQSVCRKIMPYSPEFWAWFTSVAWPSEFMLYGCAERQK